MKKLALSFLLLTFIFTSCHKEDVQILDAPEDAITITVPQQLKGSQKPIISRDAINQIALKHLNSVGEFKWDMVKSQVAWSAVMQSDSIVAIGYAPKGEDNINDRIHLIDIHQPEWLAVKEAIINFVLEEENKIRTGTKLTREHILTYDSDVLPVIGLRMTSFEAFATLRENEMMRYIEPKGYSPNDETQDQKSQLGCGSSADNNIPTSDYTTTSPNVKIPWNYGYMNISQTVWNRSTGSGITVGLIDTGVSSAQENVGSSFNSGQSSGRSLSKRGFFTSSWWCWGGCSPDGPNDDCGHGTFMSGTISAPRGWDGNMVGVAYNCNLVSCRGTDDVIINSSNEKDGVSDSYVYLGNRSDVKIISASLGDVFWSNQVADAVRYAYNRGKLIINAGGTSLSWTSWVGVTFPARMSETVAVTGITDRTSSFQKCANCHSGSQIDFVIVMQRHSNSNRTSLSLVMDGNTPGRVGGSSVATATTAGIAALVWARNPSMSRSQVLSRLKQSANYYPSRHSQFGWGLIDANQAVQ